MKSILSALDMLPDGGNLDELLALTGQQEASVKDRLDRLIRAGKVRVDMVNGEPIYSFGPNS